MKLFTTQNAIIAALCIVCVWTTARIMRLERAQKEMREVVLRLADIQSNHINELRRSVDMMVTPKAVSSTPVNEKLPTSPEEGSQSGRGVD